MGHRTARDGSQRAVKFHEVGIWDFSGNRPAGQSPSQDRSVSVTSDPTGNRTEVQGVQAKKRMSVKTDKDLRSVPRPDARIRRHGYEQFNSIVTFKPVVMRSSLMKPAENLPCSNR